MIVRSSLLAFSWGMFSMAPVSSSYLPPQNLPAYWRVGRHRLHPHLRRGEGNDWC